MDTKPPKPAVPIETVSPTGKQEVEQHAAEHAMDDDVATKPNQTKSTDKATVQVQNPKHSHTDSPERQ